MKDMIIRSVGRGGWMRWLAAALLAGGISTAAVASPRWEEPNPKREFRGAWLHVIGQSQYQDMGTNRAKQYIQDQLNKLQAAGCNAVIFQVRPTADALYKSDLEPWSQWLTGKRGRAPQPEWDPLEFTLQEAHNRGMEFHAWLNPYRVTRHSPASRTLCEVQWTDILRSRLSGEP